MCRFIAKKTNLEVAIFLSDSEDTVQRQPKRDGSFQRALPKFIQNYASKLAFLNFGEESMGGSSAPVERARTNSFSVVQLALCHFSSSASWK